MSSIAKPVSTKITGAATVQNKVTPNMVQAHGTPKAGSVNKINDNVVAVRDYVTSKGYGGAVDWDGKNPTIGGRPVPMQYNENGTAYVDKGVADRAIKQYEQNAGITGNNKVVDNFNAQYKEDINNALDRITNRKPYNWDSGSDEAFQKYQEHYARQAEDAMRRVLNKNNTSLSGASGAVLSQAMAARDDYLDDINSEYKDFEQRNYDRYLDDYDMRRADLDDIRTVANDVYDREYTANRDSINDSVAAMHDERDEKWKQTEYNDNKRFSDVDYEQALLGLEGSRINNEGSLIRNKGLELQNESAKVGLDNDKFDSAIRRASQKGRFTPDDEALIPWLADFRDGNGGYTIHPWENELLYERGLAYAQAAGQYQAYNEFNVR